VDDKDVVAAKSNAEHDIVASPSTDSPAEAKSKSSSKPPYLPKFPFTFKGRNDVIMAGSNDPGGAIKTGGSSVNQSQDPKLKVPIDYGSATAQISGAQETTATTASGDAPKLK